MRKGISLAAAATAVASFMIFTNPASAAPEAGTSAAGTSASTMSSVHVSAEYEHVNRGGIQWNFWSFENMPCNAGHRPYWNLGPANDQKISSFETWSYCSNNHFAYFDTNPGGASSGWYGGYQPRIQDMNGMGDRTRSIAYR
jgi:hypothetical protein